MSTRMMPLLFLGHGNPMNAIEENEFVKGFRAQVEFLPKPKAILCISAHWETRGTKVTGMLHPKTIHDFGGFPQELYEVQYPAPGSPELAETIRSNVHAVAVELDLNWGLDHGTWSVVKHLYPKADVPIVQLSLNQNLTARGHYELAKELAFLRQSGVLIIGSGNLVHNLGRVDWRQLQTKFGFDWAIQANECIKELIMSGNHQALIDFTSQGGAFRLAIPTVEHFLPLLYILAMKESDDVLTIFNDVLVGGSLSMTSIRLNLIEN